MLTKFSQSTSNIPIRDLKPMFDAMEHRSRKETYSASFNPPHPSSRKNDEKSVRSKNEEKIQKLSDNNKELKHLVRR